MNSYDEYNALIFAAEEKFEDTKDYLGSTLFEPMSNSGAEYLKDKPKLGTEHYDDGKPKVIVTRFKIER